MAKDEKMIKFEELAGPRTEKARDAIRRIGNLSNRSSYHYTEEHVNRIIATLEKAVKDLRLQFFPKSQTREKITFDDIDGSDYVGQQQDAEQDDEEDAGEDD